MENIVIEDIKYVISSKLKNKFKTDELHELHFLIKDTTEDLFRTLNVKRKGRIIFILSGDPGEFYKLTDLDWYIAGHYSSPNIYLQNIKSLRKKGILRNIVMHETCHFIFDQEKMETRSYQDYDFMEEVFCETINPSHSHIKSISGNLKSLYPEFEKQLKSDLKSKIQRVQANAYLLAFKWGTHLKFKYGTEVFFNKVQKRESFSDDFNQFRTKFNK